MRNLTSSDNTDQAAHRVERVRAVRHRGRLAIAGLVAISATFVLPSAASAFDQKLVSAAGIAGDRHGSAVAVDGDTAVVGAPNEAAGSGAVYVYRRTLNSWQQTGKLVAAGSAANAGLGTAVAIDGDTIVVGASAGRRTQPGRGLHVHPHGRRASHADREAQRFRREGRRHPRHGGRRSTATRSSRARREPTAPASPTTARSTRSRAAVPPRARRPRSSRPPMR